MTHVRLSITNYDRYHHDVFFYENINGKTTVKTEKEIKLEDALWMMWKLTQLGGKKTVELHPYNNHITTRDVELWDF